MIAIKNLPDGNRFHLRVDAMIERNGVFIPLNIDVIQQSANILASKLGQEIDFKKEIEKALK